MATEFGWHKLSDGAQVRCPVLEGAEACAICEASYDLRMPPPPASPREDNGESHDDAAMWADYEDWRELKITHGQHTVAVADCELCRECGPAQPKPQTTARYLITAEPAGYVVRCQQADSGWTVVDICRTR